MTGQSVEAWTVEERGSGEEQCERLRQGRERDSGTRSGQWGGKDNGKKRVVGEGVNGKKTVWGW